MKKKYKYDVHISRYGGEHTIGTIPLKVAKWWLANKTADEFEEYILSHDWEEDKDEFNKSIPEEFQINEYWHDLDDIEHMNGAEYASSNYAYVHEDKGMSTQSELVGEFPIEDVPIETTFDPVDFATDEDGMMLNDTKHDEVIVYGQSFEKGGWDYEQIVTDKPFDISKLSVGITIWDNLKIITSIYYEDKCYGNIGGDTMGKSMAFWIDD